MGSCRVYRITLCIIGGCSLRFHLHKVMSRLNFTSSMAVLKKRRKKKSLHLQHWFPGDDDMEGIQLDTEIIEGSWVFSGAYGFSVHFPFP